MPFTEISVTDAYQLLADDPSAALIDVRTLEEWTQIGVPTLESIGKRVRFAPGLGSAPVSETRTSWPRRPRPRCRDPPLLLCRSGACSQGAAAVAEAAGFGTTYNVTQGFEGDPGAAGWKHAAFPGCKADMTTAEDRHRSPTSRMV